MQSLPSTGNRNASVKLAYSRNRSAGCPFTNGIPFACGQAPEGSIFILHDSAGRVQPIQTRILARWPDRSIRWLLIDTQTRDAGESGDWTLSWGDEEQTAADKDIESPLKLSRQESWIIKNNHTAVKLVKGGMLTIDDHWGMSINLSVSGKTATAKITELKLETAGPLRVTVLGKGGFYDRRGRRIFGLRIRVSRFAGSGRIRLEPMLQIDAEKGLIHKISELNCRFFPLKPENEGLTSVVLDEVGRVLDRQNSERLFQRDDQSVFLQGAEKKIPIAERYGGGALLQGGDEGILAVAIKDFWQQWPKSIELDGHSMAVGLLPRFVKGEFSHMQPDYKYQYLFKNNAYGLRTGQSCRWELWLEPGRREVESLVALAGEPPLFTAASCQAADSGQWGLIAPVSEASGPYDQWAEDMFRGFRTDIETERNYGQMNYGDWYGERAVNWGNNEYDTPNQLLIQFARTADAAYFDAGLQSARHMSEVDVINYTNQDLTAHFYAYFKHPHYPVRPGMVHEHTVGHVSGHYSPEQVRRLFLKNGIGKGRKDMYLCIDPYNLGHIWTTGMTRAYFLTGDPWFREVVYRIGDNLARLVEDRQMKFAGPEMTHSGRQNGWTMLALAGVYMQDHRQRYLKAMKTLAQDKLAEQDPHCGGWLYELPHGHCLCEKRKHVGEAGFLTAIMVNGLAEYYRLTGDRRIPSVINRAINNLNISTWDEERGGWRYTSCPASMFHGQFGTTMVALANSVVINGDPEQRRILNKAWNAKFETLKKQLADLKIPVHGKSFGKMYTSMVLGCAEVVSVLHEASTRTASATGD